jgi:hypothetical protein
LVLFRPHDLPKLAYLAGRGAGATIRTLRHARASALSSLSNDAGDVSDARTRLQRSVRAVDAIANTLRREVGAVGFDPRQFVLAGDEERKRKRADGGMGAQDPRQSEAWERRGNSALVGSANPSMSVMVVQSNEEAAASFRATRASRNLIAVDASALSSVTGSDIVSAAIENAALAAVQARMFGGDSAGHQPRQNSIKKQP